MLAADVAEEHRGVDIEVVDVVSLLYLVAFTTETKILLRIEHE